MCSVEVRERRWTFLKAGLLIVGEGSGVGCVTRFSSVILGDGYVEGLAKGWCPVQLSGSQILQTPAMAGRLTCGQCQVRT